MALLLRGETPEAMNLDNLTDPPQRAQVAARSDGTRRSCNLGAISSPAPRVYTARAVSITGARLPGGNDGQVQKAKLAGNADRLGVNLENRIGTGKRAESAESAGDRVPVLR